MTSDTTENLFRTSLGSEATQYSREFLKDLTVEEGSSTCIVDGIVCQICEDCEVVNYPPRSLCSCCLSEQLTWKQYREEGMLLSETELHISFNNFYQEILPLRIGLVLCDKWPVFYVFLDDKVGAIGDQVKLFTTFDYQGESILVGVNPEGDVENSAKLLIESLRSKKVN